MIPSTGFYFKREIQRGAIILWALVTVFDFSGILMEQMKIAEMKNVIKNLSSHKDDKVKSQIKEMKSTFDKG